ncbi:MAG: dTMP kinase [Pseudomonadota bacterium]
MSQSGLFISFEGIDGSGKSTQTRLLADHLRNNGRDVILTREPGGSEGAEDIRKLLLEGATDRWSAETELLLFMAARRDHLERLINPAVEAGQIVICDRFVDSTRMYQGLSRGDLRQAVDMLHNLMIGKEPDLTVLIDLDPEVGLKRALSRGGEEERFEAFGVNLQAKMRQGFLALAEEFSDRFVIIDGNKTVEEIASDVRSHVDAALQ